MLHVHIETTAKWGFKCGILIERKVNEKGIIFVFASLQLQSQ